MRFLAALVVFFGHLAGQRFTAGLFWQVVPFMDEAVTIFFVISGFVIGHVVFDRREGRDAYVVARFTRIASVAVPALLATAMLDSLGQSLRPDLYNASWGFSADGVARQYLGAVLFLNRNWYADIAVGSNLPYWSLNFEVWYYVLFGIAVFARGQARMLLLVLAAALCGPVILSLLPVWLTGILAHRCCRAALLGPRAGLALFLASASVAVLYLALFAGDAGGLPQLPAIFGQEQAVHGYITGLIFGTSLVGFSAASPWLSRWVLPIAGPVRWAAGATFSIYLFHLPVAQFLTVVLPWPPDSGLARFCVLGGTLAAAFALASVTERRKNSWKPAAEAFLVLLKAGRRRLAAFA